MHDLSGNMEVFEPIVVLQMLNMAQVTGELEFRVKKNIAAVFFDRGNVTFAAIDNGSIRLGEYLTKEKIIEKKDLTKVLRKKQPGKKLGLRLIEAGVITEPELRSAVEEQIKEVIYEVVRWEKGTFHFSSGASPEEQDILIDIPLSHLMLEGLKRLDEERERT